MKKSWATPSFGTRWSLLCYSSWLRVPSRIVLGLLFALLLDQIRRFRGVFIAAALVPFVMTPVVGTLIFRDMFDRGGPYWYWMQQLFDYRLFHE